MEHEKELNDLLKIRKMYLAFAEAGDNDAADAIKELDELLIKIYEEEIRFMKEDLMEVLEKVGGRK